MHTRAAARRSAAAAQWVDLPQPLWEAIAAQLPTADVMSLRQAWRSASQLANQRVRSEASARIGAELDLCAQLAHTVAKKTGTDGVRLMPREMGGANIDFLGGYVEGVVEMLRYDFGGGRRIECTGHHAFLPETHSIPQTYRSSYELEPRHTDVIIQAVIVLTETEYPEAVDLEELRFLTTDGSLLAEYGLAYALEKIRCTTRSIRLGGGTGFGRLQGRPLGEAPAHFAAMRAAAEQQPLHTAEGRWSDGLLLPAIHAAVLHMFPLQL